MPAKTIGQAVRNWLSKISLDRNIRGRDSVHAIPSRPSPLGEPVDRTQFVTRLAKMLSQRRTVPTGRITIIGLDDLRDRLGDRWTDTAAKAYEVCDRVIRANLSEFDVYTRYSDDAYLIIFGGLSANAARLKCAVIKQEILSRFLGDPETEDVTIKAVVERLEDALLFEEMTLKDLLKPGMLHAPDSSSRSSAPPLPAALPCKRDMVFVGLAPMQDGLDRSSSVDERRKRRRPIQFVYRPFWDLRRGVISTYFCLPRAPNGADGYRYGYDVLPAGAAASHIAELDFRSMRRGLESLQSLLKTGHRVVIAIAVHFETLAMPKSRDWYIEVLRSVPPGMRDLLVLELCGLPRGVTQLRATTMVDRLRPFCRAVLIGLAFRRGLAHYGGIGVHAVGIDLSQDPRDETMIVADMNRFAKLAEASGLRCYAHGVASTSLAVQAQAAGFAYLSGDRVSAAVAEPRYMLKLSWKDFYLGRAVEELQGRADPVN